MNPFHSAAQRTFTHFNEIVRSDIYSHNRIHLMTGFFYASLIKTFHAVNTSGTVRMHMIRIGNDRKMNAIMTFLGIMLLP